MSINPQSNLEIVNIFQAIEYIEEQSGSNAKFRITLPSSIHTLGSIKDKEYAGQWLRFLICHLILSESLKEEHQQK